MKYTLFFKLKSQERRECNKEDYRWTWAFIVGGRLGQPLHHKKEEALTQGFGLHGSPPTPLFLFVSGKGEDSDVLSINADAYDSDIEGPSNEEAAASGTAAPAATAASASEVPGSTVQSEAAQIGDLEWDIENSVNEILGLVESSPKEPKAAILTVPPPEDVQPSAQQLELLELEMRARAIKALMKAGDIKKPV